MSYKEIRSLIEMPAKHRGKAGTFSGELEERITKALTLRLDFEASPAIPSGEQGVGKSRQEETLVQRPQGIKGQMACLSRTREGRGGWRGRVP